MTKTEIEKLINQHMSALHCTRDEAISIIEEDEEIDHKSMKELTEDLTDEQKKAVKSITKTTSGKSKNAGPKERKKDEEKLKIMAELLKSAQIFDENASILKAEKEIIFKIGENDYSISLIRHRNK